MKKILHFSFNQDSTCFACGMQSGFSVYNCDPPTERFNRFPKDGEYPTGVKIITMLFRSNIFAIVGDGTHPKYPPTTLIIWDDFQTNCIAELEFKQYITGVRIRRDIIVVGTENNTFIYNFANLKLLHCYGTCINPNGIIALCAGSRPIFAILGLSRGSVYIEHLNKFSHTISTHTNHLSAIALNTEGDRIATTSERGTIVRLYNTIDGELVREFRRGLDTATITSLFFDSEARRLAVCSKKGTMHVYSLLSSDNTQNRKSSLIYIQDYLPQYFSSEWSAVSFQIPINSVCAFSNNNDTMIVVTTNGEYFKYAYNIKTGCGECIEEKQLI